jgi:hypothetical protein
MQKTRLTAIFVAMILLLQIMSCNRNSYATLSPFTPTIVSYSDVYEIRPSRIENFKNTVSLSIVGESIEISGYSDDFRDLQRIRLELHFRNVSATPVVFRKPITYGFPSDEGLAKDVEFYIEPKIGPPMVFTGTSNYPDNLDGSTVPKIALADFITIEPGGIFSYQVDVLFPSVYIKDTDYAGKLLPGIYKLKAEYVNKAIGYELPLEVTPPASFDNLQAEFEWYDTHTMIVDLNAWVGQVWSDQVEFTVPEE